MQNMGKRQNSGILIYDGIWGILHLVKTLNLTTQCESAISEPSINEIILFKDSFLNDGEMRIKSLESFKEFGFLFSNL